jgi:hypothetical protein
MKPANHPSTCQLCRGCGFMDGPPEFEIVNGEPHGYTTVTTCTHHWSNDNPELWDNDL